MSLLQAIEALKQKAKSGEITAAEKLRLRRLRLELDEQKLAARAAKLSQRKRAEETRVKIILGAWVLHNRNRPEFKALMASFLPEFLSEKDRLFVDAFLE